MAGRNMNRGKATPPYEWRHGWIPLTPGAALTKAKGSQRAATRLKAKHNITAASARPNSPARNGGTATRTVGRSTGSPERRRTQQADIPTPDTTVAAQRRRAAIAQMSDAQLADRRGRASNGQTQRFIDDELAKREQQRRGATANAQSARAAELRDRAAAERAKLQGIADRAGPPTTDPQANRLSARGLKQAHRNTDSSLRRFTETQQRANALESKAHLAEARAKEAGRTRLTRTDVEGATHIVDQHGQAREVVRVNAKTVTVKTPYSWTETVPIEKIRRAIKATPEQIAEARRRAAAARKS